MSAKLASYLQTEHPTALIMYHPTLLAKGRYREKEEKRVGDTSFSHVRLIRTPASLPSSSQPATNPSDFWFLTCFWYLTAQ